METVTVIACMTAFLCLCVCAYVIGRMLQYGRHRLDFGFSKAFLSGSFLICVILFLIRAVGVCLKLSFVVQKWLCVGMTVLVTMIGIVLLRTDIVPDVVKKLFAMMSSKGEKKERFESHRMVVWMIAIVLFICNIIAIRIYEPYFANDATLEETVTILEQGELFACHPVTGAELVYGVDAWAKLNFVPGFYAIVCDVAGADPYDFVCSFMPVYGLLLNYAAVYWLVDVVTGTGMKRKQRDLSQQGHIRKMDRDMRGAYTMALYGMLVLMGDYADVMPAFYLLHQGWNPVVIVSLTGIPMLIAGALCVLRLSGSMRRRASLHE